MDEQFVHAILWLTCQYIPQFESQNKTLKNVAIDFLNIYFLNSTRNYSRKLFWAAIPYV